jgi:hypothetical protein
MTNSPPETPVRLSAAGSQRKVAILAVAEQALAGRVRTARSRQALIALAAIAIAVGVATPFIRTPPGPDPAGGQFVGAKPSVPTLDRIDDEELLNELAALGHDVGLVRVGNRSELVTSDGRPIDRRTIVRPVG